MAAETPNYSGYTLLEILIVMSIMGVILAMGAVNYNTYTKRQIITQEALTLKDALRSAATNASAGQKPIGITCTQLVGYQVSFSDNTYSTQAICNPDAPDAPIYTVTLNRLLAFDPVPAPVLFNVLNGGVSSTAIPTASDSATLNLSTTYSTIKYVITISAQGDISTVGLK